MTAADEKGVVVVYERPTLTLANMLMVAFGFLAVMATIIDWAYRHIAVVTACQ